jgi:CheY-like chemotaxis protein
VATVTTEAFRQAASAIKAGRKDEARRLLDAFLRDDPENEQGWLWRAAVCEERSEAIRTLERVLKINPENKQALMALEGYHRQAQQSEQHPSNGQNGSANTAATLASMFGGRPNSDGASQNAGFNGFNTGNPGAGSNSGFSKPNNGGFATPSFGNRPNAANSATASVSSSPAISAPAQSAQAQSAQAQSAQAQSAPAQSAPAQPVQATAHRADSRPNPAWRCPLCAFTASQKQAVCGGCRAVVDLDDLDAIAKNSNVDERQIASIMQNAMAQLRGKHSADTYLTLTLGYLNLKASHEALPFLEVLAKHFPTNGKFTGALAKLKARKLILAVDDSPTIRKILSLTLERAQYRVSLAGSGQEAVTKAQSLQPDLVLLDITMPGMDGYQVCKELRAIAKFKQTPIVMLSGKDGFFDKVKGKMAGATTYITKPFDPAALVQTIGTVVKA